MSDQPGTPSTTEKTQIGACAVCSRTSVRVHHIRRLGDLSAGRLACVDERTCFTAFLMRTPSAGGES